MKIYCTECGAPTEYVSKKPNFCSACGYSFIAKASLSPKQPDQNLDEDSEENDVKELDPRIYAMKGLEVDVTVNKPRGITFGEMFPKLGRDGDEKQKG